MGEFATAQVEPRGSLAPNAPRRMLLSVSLSGGQDAVLERRLLLLRFLQHANPLRDEFHMMIDDHDQLWTELVRRVCAAVLLQRRRANQPEQLAKIVLLQTKSWNLPAHERKGHPMNLRVALIKHYLSVLLPDDAPYGLILTCDSRDLYLQSNPFDAFERYNIRSFDSVRGDMSAPFHGVFAAGETWDLTTQGLNQKWVGDIVGPRARDAIHLIHDDALNASVPRTLPSGRALPVLNSGVYGGTFQAMRDFHHLYFSVLSCGANIVILCAILCASSNSGCASSGV